MNGSVARPRVTISTVGLPLREENLLRSLLRALTGKTRHAWQFIDDVEADVLLCDPDSPLAQQVCAQRAVDLRRRCIHLWRAREVAAPTGTLPWPPRPADVLDVLDRVELLAGPGVADAAALRSTPAAPADSTALPEHPVQRVLRSVRADPDPRPSLLLLDFGSHRLELATPVLRFSPAAEADAGVLGVLARATRLPGLSLVPAAKARTLPPDERWIPVERLLWQAGINGAGDELHPALTQETRYRLLRWPDFGRTGFVPEYLRLAALLSRTPMSCADVVAAVTVPPGEVVKFLNAAYLCGLLERMPDSEDRVARAPRADAERPRAGAWSGVMRRIRSALGMRQGSAPP